MSLLNFNKWIDLNENAKFDPNANYPDKTFGYALGAVDTGRANSGGSGGDWGGSMPRALWFARVADDWAKANGLVNEKRPTIVSSQKRSRVKTASGSVSDHYAGNSDAYAVDLAVSGSNGDALLAHIMEKFGHPEYKGGSWFNTTIKGYRYQIGWNVANHYDHIHVGVKRVVGGSGSSTGKGGTFGEKVANNPEVVAWFAKNAPKAKLTGEFINQLVKEDPKKLEWFKKKFNIDSSGNPVGSSTPSTGSIDDRWMSITKKVIDNFEGGYWNYWECKSHPYSAMFKNSGETMFGLDRKAGAIENIKPEGEEFFKIIDSQKKELGMPAFCEKWKYNYRGGELEDKLKDLASKIMLKQYKSNMSNFVKDAETKRRIENNNGLLLHMSYACWNGPGFFKKFANALKKGVKEGKSDKQLIEIAKTTRASALSGYWAKGSETVNRLIDKEAGLA